MYLRRESARMPASTFQAYPVYPGDCREIKGPALLPRLFSRGPRKDNVPHLTADRIIVEHSMVLTEQRGSR